MGEGMLFRAFSKHALEMPDGPPPFLDEMDSFAERLDAERLEAFFEGRCEWHWYPILTLGFSSGSVHHDLIDVLGQDQLLEAIGYAAPICAREDGERFVSALGLLMMLCRAVETPAPVDSLTAGFMAIREAATRNAIDSNIRYWFDQVASFQKKGGVDPLGFDGTWFMPPPGE